MKHAEARQAAEALFDRHSSPFGGFSLGSETHQAATIPDAVRRCRWIALDLGADYFGLFFSSPSPERHRLVPCFDSDYPGVSVATKFISGSNGEEVVRASRTSSEPVWWSDGFGPEAEAPLQSLGWARRVAPLVPATSGLAFPVQAEKGQSGMVIFAGDKLAPTQDMLFEIHARCFSLFAAVARIRPGDLGRVRAMSKRELECLKLTANGCTSEEIARRLKLSVHTANQYLTQSAHKLNAVNRMQAVAKALRLGLID